MTLELLVSSLSLAFISSADIVGGATEGEAVAVGPLVACVAEAGVFEYLEMVLDNSGGLAPSTRSMTLPS